MLIGPLDKGEDYRLRLFIQGSAFATTLTSNTPRPSHANALGKPAQVSMRRQSMLTLHQTDL